MSIDLGDRDDAAEAGVQKLIARAASVPARAARRLDQLIDDFFLSDDARLDDRARALAAATLAAVVTTVEGDLRRGAGRLLDARGDAASAHQLAAAAPVLDRLVQAQVLRDAELIGELIARVQMDVLADSLPLSGEGDAGLLVRLTGAPDGAVATAAAGLMQAEGRRRAFIDTNRLTATDLPAELQHKLVWRVAAALRAGIEPAAALLDQALAETAARALAGYDEGDRLDAAAMRLATALDPTSAELPDLLLGALADRRPALFTALLAQSLGIAPADARGLLLERAPEPLWLALRAVPLEREAVARIGLALGEAGRAGALDLLAEQIDTLMAVTPDQARLALAGLKLPADYRAAVAALRTGR